MPVTVTAMFVPSACAILSRSHCRIFQDGARRARLPTVSCFRHIPVGVSLRWSRPSQRRTSTAAANRCRDWPACLARRLLSQNPMHGVRPERIHVLHVTYDGLPEPLGRSQVVSYLLELARGGADVSGVWV